MTGNDRRMGQSGDYRRKGMIMVVSAPSGAGKTSVMAGFMKLRPEVRFSVSVTTRPPRKGERPGRDYHFVTPEEFNGMIGRGEFAEWAEVHGNRYGTKKKALDDAIAGGDTIVLDTDTVGAFNIKRCYPEAVLVFVVTPTPGALEERLRARNTESDDVVRMRLGAAPHEVARMPEYDYIIVNDELDAAVGRMVTIFDAEMMKSDRILYSLTDWKEDIDGRKAD